MSARVQALGTAMPDGFVFKQSEIVESFFARQPGWDPAWAEVFAAFGPEERMQVYGRGLRRRGARGGGDRGGEGLNSQPGSSAVGVGFTAFR